MMCLAPKFVVVAKSLAQSRSCPILKKFSFTSRCLISRKDDEFFSTWKFSFLSQWGYGTFFLMPFFIIFFLMDISTGWYVLSTE